MSRMPWFRMYHEARTDNKLRALSDAQHRCWFNLMCLASEGDDNRGSIVGYDDDLLAIEVGATVDVLRETIALLVKLRVLTADTDCLVFINFAKRQSSHPERPSDAPERVRERVARYRGTDGNGVTASGNDPDTAVTAREEKRREDKSREEDTPPVAGGSVVHLTDYSDAFEAFWRVYPRRLEKKAAWRQWRARLKAGADPSDLISAAEHYAVAKHRQQAEPQHIKHAATFIGQDEHYRDWIDGVPAGEDRGPAGKNGRYDRNLDGLYAAGSRIGFEERQ